MRLWDFYDKREVPPELWSSFDFNRPEKILRVFVNEHGFQSRGRGPYFFVVVTSRRTCVFQERLEVVGEICLPAECGPVTSCAFNAENTHVVVGTANGQLCCWDIIASKLIDQPFSVGAGKPVTQI